MIDKYVVECLALLGPDLGDEGETILRRVAQDAPSWLRPAVEELFTGRALATYRRGFLAELTEAYYLNEEENGSGFHEDGIRDHYARGLPVPPLSAWYRGPFMALFQSDFRNGVTRLNRMLNHAALARARILAGLDHYGAPLDDTMLDVYRTELEITGTRRVYVGDPHVWFWYRGTGVGPYPCMSALQALERVCDHLIQIGIPLANIIAILLRGCENLAMVGLVVGVLVRHIEHAGQLLDPYLADPRIWHLEFGRVASERGGLAAPSDGLAAPERRQWSLRDVAMQLVLRADEARAGELRAVGQRLVDAARRLVVEKARDIGGAAVEAELVTVRAWANCLDRSTYWAQRADEGIYIQSRLPDDIAQAMRPTNEDLQRGQEATRLMVRYCVRAKNGRSESVSPEDLASDLSVAEELLQDPPTLSAVSPWDTPTAVAAAALEAHFAAGAELPPGGLRFAVDVVVRVGEGEASPRQLEFDETYFELGAERSAARVLPFLLLPNAEALRACFDGGDGSGTLARVAAAAGNLARNVANEVRVHLARGLDRVWASPCRGGGVCHHETALQLAVETMRDSVLGAWDPSTGERSVVILADPVARSLGDAPDEDIYLSRLDAAIRALAPATIAGICVSARAREILAAALAAHRRSLLAHEEDMDSRGTHALIAARALLTIAADGDETLIYEHIDAFGDNSTLLGGFLRALSAAAEESPDRATTARRMWPGLASHVLDLHASGHTSFGDRHRGDDTLAALMPNPAGEVAYLYREVERDPVVWWDPRGWQATVARWLPLARGNPTCVDHLIAFVAALERPDQARIGLPWVADLVLADPGRLARRSFLLSSWLIELRPACGAGLLPVWQRVVDALVVAGNSRLAPYSV